MQEGNPEADVLVSVILRTMGRACLQEALASLECQTYPHIEAIVVHAQGMAMGVPDRSLAERALGQIPLREVVSDSPLSRSQAANAGLAQAQGDLALFLDEDDLLDADHIQRLCTCLQVSPASPAAYTGVRMTDGSGAARELNIAWERDRLMGMNFLPIHGVLFRLRQAYPSCQFDTSLDVLEDWDFWLQLAQQGDFVNLPGCSATYRMELGQSGLSAERDLDRFRQAHARVLQKWGYTEEQYSRMLLWFGSAVDYLQREASRLQQESAQYQFELAESQMHLRQQENLAQIRAEMIESLHASTSWKITAPLRAVVEKIRPRS